MVLPAAAMLLLSVAGGCAGTPGPRTTRLADADLTQAVLTIRDQLAGSAVVTGQLQQGSTAFGPPVGLDGPEQFYTFTLTKRARVESAVAANTAYWSKVAGPVGSSWRGTSAYL